MPMAPEPWIGSKGDCKVTEKGSRVPPGGVPGVPPEPTLSLPLLVCKVDLMRLAAPQPMKIIYTRACLQTLV